MTATLTDRDRAVLAFERRWWREPGAKEAEIRHAFGMSATRYYQHLRHLAQQPAAVEHAPDVCNRVRRQMTRIPAVAPVYNPPADAPTLT